MILISDDHEYGGPNNEDGDFNDKDGDFYDKDGDLNNDLNADVDGI
jgi:hypothetical protein